MRESIGGTWIMGIVVFFIVLFSGYLALSVNYSKAFKVKNGIVNVIEKNNGYNENARNAIEEYLNQAGYAVYSACGDRGNGGGPKLSGSTNKYRYCIKKNTVDESLKETETINRTYYTVTVFFKVDLPIFSEVFLFPVYGETKTIHFVQD